MEIIDKEDNIEIKGTTEEGEVEETLDEIIVVVEILDQTGKGKEDIIENKNRSGEIEEANRSGEAEEAKAIEAVITIGMIIVEITETTTDNKAINKGPMVTGNKKHSAQIRNKPQSHVVGT